MTEWHRATPGLDLSIPAEVGTVDSLSLSRIVADDRRTWSAQLTLNCLADSPVARAHNWLRLRAGDGALHPGSVAQPGAPLTGAEGGRR